MGTWYCSTNGLIFQQAHDSAYATRCEEALHPRTGESSIVLDRRRHQYYARPAAKLSMPCCLASFTVIALAGVVVRVHAEEDDPL